MDLMQALGSVAGKSTASRIGRAFDFMSIAERVIASHSRKGSRVWKESFGVMNPGELIEFSEELFAAHCYAMLRRVKGKCDTRPGTDAEVCAALCQMSLKAPLSRSYVRAYEDAMGRLGLLKGAPTCDYSYPGEGDEILAELRRATAKADRLVRP